jgi:hypothetical protein
MTRTRAYLESWRERELQDIAIPGRIDTTAYILVGLAAAAYPPDPATDALARYVKRRQLADGSWHVASHRPPIESSDIGVTALALRSLRRMRPRRSTAEYARAVQRGAAWLTHAQPKIQRGSCVSVARPDLGRREASRRRADSGECADRAAAR